jgi:hypothetical protein
MKIIITEKQRDLLMVKGYSDFDKAIQNVLLEQVIKSSDEVDGHLPESIIDDIAEKHPKIADYLRDICKDGAGSVLDSWRKEVNNDEKEIVQIEDLIAISQWINNSVMNKNPRSVKVPPFVIELVRKLEE